ncbi:unnamed protein product [Diplocarpon coronariae]
MDQFQDRQDAQIWTAIEAKNFKQALKLVDKRLAKKHTEYHEALRIYIRALFPQVSEKSAVLLKLEELAAKKTVLADLVVLDLYDDSLEEVLPEPGERWAKVIGELRWQSVKASPKAEDTSINCFQRCLARNDLDHARQIANSLEKSFPKNRDYIFWNISTMFLFSIQPNCPETQKKIWGGLALGQMGKLANATKQAMDQKQVSIRSIQSPQELLLLQRVTQVYGKPEQCLEYLRDPLLGPESAVAKGEWELWRIKLGLTEKAQQWKELFEITGSLLKRSRTAGNSGKYVEARLSDWIVWDAYVRSSTELNDNEFPRRVRAECQAHLDPACGIDKSWKRNASLALVTVAFEDLTPFSESVLNDDDISYKVTTIVNYLQAYASASTAYNDIKLFVGQLSQDERKQLLGALAKGMPFGNVGEHQSLATARQITESINTTKLKYLLGCSLPEYERGAQWPVNRRVKSRFRCIFCSNPCGTSCITCLEAITKESITSYRIAIKDDGLITRDLLPTDRHPADDFAILAAISLVKLALQHPDNASEPLKTNRASYLLQATALLEKAWIHSKSNFQISLLLVRLYVYLGCGSLAMRAFQRLALKQVQLDTLSYTLFDRISSFHPHPFTHTPDGLALSRTPIEQLRKHQKLYKSAEEHVAKNVWLSFKHKSYNSVFEIKEAEDNLSRSLARVMSVIEGKKVARLTEPKRSLSEISQEFDILQSGVEDSETPFADTNDVETFPNYESTAGPRFEEISRFMPGPSDTRYRLNLSTEKLHLIIDPSVSSSGEAFILQQWLKQHLDSKKQNLPTTVIGKYLTQAEVLAQSTYDTLALIISTACDKGLWAKPEVKVKVDGYNKDLVKSLENNLASVEHMESIVPAFQSTLHALYTAHEVGTVAVKFCSYISRRGKDVYEKQADANKAIAAVAQQLLQTVAAKCAAVKKGLDEGGWIDRVLESVLPDENGGISELSVETVAALRKLVDENFMEEWAGEVVESWKDSVVGFSLLKTLTKA